jgi:starvation-inducible DNA-binding protein
MLLVKSFMEVTPFENQYKQLESSIDEIAERISKLGGKRLGQWMNSKKNTFKRVTSCLSNSSEMINELLNDHEAVVVQLRKDISTSEEDNAILEQQIFDSHATRT